MTIVDCLSASLSNSCSWQGASASSCTVNKNLCTLNGDGISCSNAANCSIAPATNATCEPVGAGFGCFNNPDETTCSGATQCTWSAGSCKSDETCEK